MILGKMKFNGTGTNLCFIFTIDQLIGLVYKMLKYCEKCITVPQSPKCHLQIAIFESKTQRHFIYCLELQGKVANSHI